MPKLGLTLAPGSKVAGSDGSGVVVTAVDPNGVAADHLRVGDVILDVSGKSVSSPADVRSQISEAHKEGKHALLFRVKSNEGTRFVAHHLPLPRGSSLPVMAVSKPRSPARRRPLHRIDQAPHRQTTKQPRQGVDERHAGIVNPTQCRDAHLGAGESLMRGFIVAVLLVFGTILDANAHQWFKDCADQMISVFENESTSPRYDYIENLHDGRGYTAGRSGFATGEGDLLQVIDVYDLLRPNNGLSGFIPTLKKVRGTRSTEGLEGLPAEWRKAALDPLFRQAQDQVSDMLYYTPATKAADTLHLQSPLARFALYDAIVQHGNDQNDSDSLPGVIRAATRAVGPPHEAGEETWLRAFLTARKQVLLNARDPETRAAWKESVGRVDEQLRLLNESNLQLSARFTLNPYGTKFIVKCATPSSTSAERNGAK